MSDGGLGIVDNSQSEQMESDLEKLRQEILALKTTLHTDLSGMDRTADGREITCHVGGDMRMKVVRVLPGEGVVLELSPLDPSKGRIVGKTGSTQRDASRSGTLNGPEGR